MIRHIALLTWRDEATEDEIVAVEEALAALPAQIPSIRRYVFGRDVGVRTGNASFGIVADFDDVDGYDAYDRAPAHREVLASVVGPILAARSAVQLEIS